MADSGNRVGWKHDSERGNRHARGYDSAWERARKAKLTSQNGLCQRCLRAGRRTPATEVHHVRGFGGLDDPKRLDPANLDAVCENCHLGMTAPNTDNANLPAKLELRRHFLRKYHADRPPEVLDCCQGEAVIWNKLRDEFEVATYWGVDLKPKKGRLKIDSVRILQQPGWPQNVVDIDTYGSPWKHWEALLPNLSRPTTVFLTIAQIMAAGGFQQYPRAAIKAIGISEEIRAKAPATLLAKVGQMAVSYCLTRTCDFGIIIVEAVEAVSAGNARYIGVRLEPGKTNGQGCNPDRSEQTIPDKEESNV
jgi:5-methylcytosine-specific restriction endonuclease McrA